MIKRHTYVVNSRLARAQLTYETAKDHVHGRQIFTPAQAARKLAGGFIDVIDPDELREALNDVLNDGKLPLGDLENIRGMPGMGSASSNTLNKVWVKGLDLESSPEVKTRQRVKDVALLEKEVLKKIPTRMYRPKNLVHLAIAQMDHAPSVLGSVTLYGIPDLDEVWRPLLINLAEVVPVIWQHGFYKDPPWLEGTKIQSTEKKPLKPKMTLVECATPRHEVQEALRWARELIAVQSAKPENIAIAAAVTDEWDVHILALARDADLPISFPGGRLVTTCREGQACAALADILINDFNRRRVVRLLTCVRGMTEATEMIPFSWERILLKDRPLDDEASWSGLIDDSSVWPDGMDFGKEFKKLIKTIERGRKGLEDGQKERVRAVGKELLSEQAYRFWLRALERGRPDVLDITLSKLRQDMEGDPHPNEAIIWCTAADLAASPRPFMRLLGLNSSRWPRRPREDPLLPETVIGGLDPVPIEERDRRDLDTICKSATEEVVLSSARRTADGRKLAVSPIVSIKVLKDTLKLYRERTPEHASSEADRLLARPDEFKTGLRSQSANLCWKNWRKPEVTPHDGLVKLDHPLIYKALENPFSATSLVKLVRDPLGYLWKYVFRWSAPPPDEDPTVLDHLQIGSLTHRTLELAVDALESVGGFWTADRDRIGKEVDKALSKAGEKFEDENRIPPNRVWRVHKREIRAMALGALTLSEAEEPTLLDQSSYTEVPFGGSRSGEEIRERLPWDPDKEVLIPGTDLLIRGYIDRLDISEDRLRARVTDYKTGKHKKKNKEDIILDGGRELQRCLYAYAVQTLFGGEIEVRAKLLYLGGDAPHINDLEDPRETLEKLTPYLVTARKGLLAGKALCGDGSGERDTDELTFALPAQFKRSYWMRKQVKIKQSLEPLPELWDMT